MFLVLVRAVSEPHGPRFLHLTYVRLVQLDTYHLEIPDSYGISPGHRHVTL